MHQIGDYSNPAFQKSKSSPVLWFWSSKWNRPTTSMMWVYGKLRYSVFATRFYPYLIWGNRGSLSIPVMKILLELCKHGFSVQSSPSGVCGHCRGVGSVCFHAWSWLFHGCGWKFWMGRRAISLLLVYCYQPTCLLTANNHWTAVDTTPIRYLAVNIFHILVTGLEYIGITIALSILNHWCTTLLPEPTYLSPVRSVACSVMNITVSGIIFDNLRFWRDMHATKEVVINKSCLPVSIITVGIGQEDFTAMEFSDTESRCSDAMAKLLRRHCKICQ